MLRLLKVLSLAISAVVLTACATTSEIPLDKTALQSAINDAQKKAVSRGVEYTVSELQKLTLRNPTDAEPWSQLAKVHFDREQYGQAIVAADEALQRNPKDFLAKSIWVVGGLRLAQKGIMDMRADAKLAGDAQNDALQLADAMRKVLGQTIFPSVQNTDDRFKPIVSKNPKKPTSATGGASNPTSLRPNDEDPPPARQPSGNSNPFESLF
jgi:tetratricopeptide (TPR) repeat protein